MSRTNLAEGSILVVYARARSFPTRTGPRVRNGAALPDLAAFVTPRSHASRCHRSSEPGLQPALRYLIRWGGLANREVELWACIESGMELVGSAAQQGGGRRNYSLQKSKVVVVVVEVEQSGVGSRVHALEKSELWSTWLDASFYFEFRADSCLIYDCKTCLLPLVISSHCMIPVVACLPHLLHQSDHLVHVFRVVCNSEKLVKVIVLMHTSPI